MKNEEKLTNIMCELLRLYNQAKNPSLDEIINLVVHKSSVYGMQNVYSFTYKGSQYYATDDYSLMDNPKYIEAVIKEFYPNLTGKPLKTIQKQSDRAQYACGINGVEYYLWQEN